MSSERDTIIDFIEWLEDTRRIYLVQMGQNEKFITCQSGGFKNLQILIKQWGEDIETNL
jgi:hypothetical protein